MNILMLSQFYPPIMGGIERHVQNLSQALAQKGHTVSVATLWHNGLPEFEERDGVNIYRVRGTMQRMTSLFTTDRQHAPPFADPEVTLAMRRVIKTVRPQIVHAHDWMVRSFLPLKRWSKAKLVRTLHDCELACAQMRYMYKDTQRCDGPAFGKCTSCVVHHYGKIKGPVTLYANWLTGQGERNLVDAYIPVSKAIAAANHLDPNSASVRVIPNFVPNDVADRESSASTEQLPPPGFILQVGDLVPDKGIGVLLDAYRQLQSPPPLVLIGRRTAQSPRDLPVGATIIESLPHPLVMEAWKRCIFGTIASTCLDASPTVTLEAMASGKPVIGSRLGGITDQIIEGETGFLVEPGNPVQLRDAMARMIADPALRKRTGEAAKNRVRDFYASAVVAMIESVYQTLCSC